MNVLVKIIFTQQSPATRLTAYNKCVWCVDPTKKFCKYTTQSQYTISTNGHHVDII